MRSPERLDQPLAIMYVSRLSYCIKSRAENDARSIRALAYLQQRQKRTGFIVMRSRVKKGVPQMEIWSSVRYA